MNLLSTVLFLATNTAIASSLILVQSNRCGTGCMCLPQTLIIAKEKIAGAASVTSHTGRI
jgi:hypothetical protein